MKIVKTGAKIIITATAVAVSVLALVAASRYRARVACDRFVASQADELRHYSTCFTFHPERYLWSREPLNSKAGWIVSYVDESGFRSLGFHVSLMGDVLASGASLAIPQVAKRHVENEKFLQSVAQVADLLQPGTSYSDIISALGTPMSETKFSNDVVRLDYVFGMARPSRGHFATNGFVIVFSNNVVVTNMPITTM